MTIADYFDPASDAGFVRFYDLRTARRQFQISLVLILIMAMTAFALGFFVRLNQQHDAVPTPNQHEINFAVNDSAALA
jgi:Na+(H+)/acetate symporter ActP